MKNKIQMLALGFASLFTSSVAQAATITWTGQGLITSDTFLTLAGTTGDEVYGVDFGGAGSLTTANGYSFGSGNFTEAGGGSSYNGYLNGQTSGDVNLDTILADGNYGRLPANSGTLLNLTIGQTYDVLAFIDDNRGNAAGGTQFQINDGTANSPIQAYGTYGSTPGDPLGGYLLGTFTADATTQAFSVQNNNQAGSFSTDNAQYNGILVEAAPEPSTFAMMGGSLALLMAVRRNK
jgi:hypothetical protein